MIALPQIRTLSCSNSVISLFLVTISLLTVGCTESPERRPSPLTVDSTVVKGNLVSIEYSSPRVKGRKIFGLGDDYLVKFGEMWRTGANDATVLSLESSIEIDTFILTEGKYALFTIPGKNSWEIIINSEWDQWGSYYKKDSLDVARFFVDTQNLDSISEQMRFTFGNGSLNFSWENVGWSIPIR